MKKFYFILVFLIIAAFRSNAQYSVTSIPYNPYPFNTGTAVLVNIDDVWSSVINLPFDFYFFIGSNYNQLVIGGNGCISFDPANAGNYCAWSFITSCPNPNIINGSTGPFIFGPYHDMDPSVAGNIYYATYGMAPYRKFVVSWDSVAMFSASCNSLLATQQIVLYETYNYIDVYIQNKPLCSTWNQGNAVIGVQDVSGMYGISPPGRNTGAWTATNEAWRFSMGPYGMIKGNIFRDMDLDCVPDSGENALPNWMVKVDPGPFYALTDSNGNYKIFVDTGTYTVTQIVPNNLWQQECPASPNYYTAAFTSTDTSSGNDFAIKADVLCALLHVDISSWAVLRPCNTVYYSVNYCNNGTAPAVNAYVEVTFDSIVTPVSSTLPWSLQNGNTYTFNLGTVLPLQCNSFTIATNISCNAIVGSTHCIEARIYPDSLCFPPDSAWDHSSIHVEGTCVSDSLACFTIYNTGDPVTGDMQSQSEYRIYENNILVYTGHFQIPGGDSLVICRPTNGNAVRLEADQVPGHPGNSHPQETVENCGDSTGSSFGQIILVPEDDADYNVEIDCREIVASYDPNEKYVKPVGITQDHFIDPSDILEYQIDFQNTGTDTAFKVVIRDTLSEYLDVATVETGLSSHPCSFEISGQRVIKWTFNNILLPDSSTNEPASHGFVKFKIHQKPGNADGTLIENRADIVFDNNIPVLTSTVWNIVNDTLIITLASPVHYNNVFDVIVFPNPFSDYTTFIVSGLKTNEVYSMIVFDLLGKAVKQVNNIRSNVFCLRKDKLTQGMYFYKLFNEKGNIAAGRIIIN